MPKYGRVVNDVVQETFTPPEGLDIEQCFHPNVAAQFQSVPEEVEALWLRTGPGSWAPPE